MKVTVTTLSDEIFTLVVSGEMELENFKAFCESESGIPAREIVVMHEGRPLLDDRKDLQSYGIKEGDILLIQQFVLQRDSTPGAVGIDFSSIQVPGRTTQPSVAVPGSSTGNTTQEDTPENIRKFLLSNPEHLAVLKHNNPRLADAFLSGDHEKFASMLREQQQERVEKERQRIRIMNADLFDLEAQRLIAEDIKQENIDSNMEAAMEYQPESFGQVVMLYINCKVNGHPVKAFIDSGAQTTIMSQACAERCSIMRLVDPRWAGIAKGVGTQKIIGRVHLVQIEIGQDFLTSSFSILEDQPMDMLLGLDMLKRHQCCIDLKRNVLAIGTTNTETPFLNESDLPECARLQFPQLASPSSHLQEQEDRQLAEALARSSQEAHSGGEVFPETDIEKVTKMGFSRDEAVGALRKTNGDINQAVAALLAKSLVLP